VADPKEREKIEYEFEDLRRNTDPVPSSVLAQFGGFEEEEQEETDERQEGERHEGKDEKDDDRAGNGEDQDADPKRLSRELTRTRQRAERTQRQLRQARSDAEQTITDLQGRIEKLEKRGSANGIDAEYTTKVSDLEAKIEAAMEAGNSKDVIRLNRELAELTAEHKIKRAQAEAHETQDERQDRRDRPTTIPRAQEWLDEQDWFDDPEQAHVRAYLNKLDRVLQQKGYRPSDDDYYEQLEAKLDETFPGVVTLTMERRDDDDDEDEEDEFSDIPRRGKKRRRESPVNSGDQSGSLKGRRERESQRSEKKLTRTRIANMRAFGLDPDNKDHVEEYLRGVDR
jgi:hypothetical protein